MLVKGLERFKDNNSSPFKPFKSFNAPFKPFQVRFGS